MTRTSRLPAALMTFALGAFFAMGAFASPALAADDDVTWSVRPANADGPDGRSWIEQTLDPGEQIVEHLALTNLSTTTVTFTIQAADGYLTPTGRFNMLPSDVPSEAAGLWIEGPESIEVAADETQIVAFTITVPDNATPGDHAAGIAATVQSIGPDGAGNQVSIESRVGFPVMTRVTGELRPVVAIESSSIEYRMSWNPFQPGQVIANYQVLNDGNVRVEVVPVVESQGRTAEEADSSNELLPGERRELSATVTGVWPLFYSVVQVRLDPTVVSLDGETLDADTVIGEFGVWTLPLPQLLVLTGAAMLVLAVLVGRRRSQLRVETLVAEARDAGRREVSS